jgi:hypothetical protein
MKRILPVVLIFLLMLLNACGTPTPAINMDMHTAVAQTQTASMWTPTATSTPDPNEKLIVEWLNESLSAIDPLERTLDAYYRVDDAAVFGSSASMTFSVEIHCECPSNAQCCVPERMFVITMRAMKNRRDDIFAQMPGNVNDMHLVCYNHQTFMGTMVANWADVKSYLQDEISGFQLGTRVYRVGTP